MTRPPGRTRSVTLAWLGHCWRMTYQRSIDRARYYRERAAEVRAQAETMRDYEARQTMRQVAFMWDLMAERVENEPRPWMNGPA